VLRGGTARGSIYVDSDGAGATFTEAAAEGEWGALRRRRAGESFGASDLPASAPLPLTGLQVVVDDDSDTRDFLTTVLEKQGLR